jgi:hypothetical protein
MANITVNLGSPMIDLDGKPYPGEDTLGKVLAHRLAHTQKGESIKYYDWAMSLWAGKSLIVDQADFDKLKEFAKNDEQLVNISKAQILKALDQCKEDSKTSKK